MITEVLSYSGNKKHTIYKSSMSSKDTCLVVQYYTWLCVHKCFIVIVIITYFHVIVIVIVIGVWISGVIVSNVIYYYLM